MPNSEDRLAAGWPNSASVGTWGSESSRAGEPTASGLGLAPLICCGTAGDAQRTAPGLACAAAMRSLKSAALLADVPSSSTGEYITLTTGAMSFWGSNGDLPRCGLSASGLTAAKPRV